MVAGSEGEERPQPSHQQSMYIQCIRYIECIHYICSVYSTCAVYMYMVYVVNTDSTYNYVTGDVKNAQLNKIVISNLSYWNQVKKNQTHHRMELEPALRFIPNKTYMSSLRQRLATVSIRRYILLGEVYISFLWNWHISI